MRKFKMGLVTLAATAGIFAPVGVATANPLINVEFCNAQGACSPVTSTAAAVNVCPSVDVAALLVLQKGGSVKCVANGGSFIKN